MEHGSFWGPGFKVVLCEYPSSCSKFAQQIPPAQMRLKRLANKIARIVTVLLHSAHTFGPAHCLNEQ